MCTALTHTSETSVDGFKAKTPTQHLDGHAQQQDIDSKKGVLHGELRGIEYHCCRTGQTTCGNFVRQLETSEPHGIHYQANGDDYVVANVLRNRRFEFGNQCCKRYFK